MTIEEAIAHCYEVVEGKTEQGKCESCAHEHKQLAMWLEELVAYRKLISRENAPLTLDELREMDGEPVFIKSPGHLGKWVLTRASDGNIYFMSGAGTWVSEKVELRYGGKVYRRKPEGKKAL